jgi:hypothetical protein|tara:strand:- start:153 stop:560 length:408 start_codon:yes stop_codon:yes gene_type:complete
MAKHKDPISKALDIEPIQGEVVPVDEPKVNPEMENDFKYARENLYNIIERGSDALNGIVDLAQQSQHPRSFEVVADLVRTLSTANKDLLDLQKKMKDLQPEEKKNQKVTNNLFVGTTKDLTDLLEGGARKIKPKK